MAELKTKLESRMPELDSISSITPTPYKGIYEVVNDGDIYYSTEDGSAVIYGQLFDTDKRVNVTRERTDELDRVPFDKLPLDLAIKVGNGTRKVAVFEDPKCPYCKAYETTLSKIDDLTVYVFVYPILSAQSHSLAKDIWCAKDQAKAWLDWILRDKAPPSADKNCVSRVAEIVEFGKKHRVKSTPTSFFANSERAQGALPKQAVEKKLAAK